MHTGIMLGLFIFLIVFSPLPYASVAILPLSIIEVTIALLCCVWLAALLFRKQLVFVKSPLLVPACLFSLVIGIQILPLPAGVVEAVSPQAIHFYKTLVYREPLPSFITLSLYPEATVGSFLSTISLLLLFLAAINTINSRGGFRVLISAIIATGLAISLFGIIQKYAYGHLQKVYWFDANYSAGMPFGTFVNRNNFAGYITMIIPLALGYFLFEQDLGKKALYGLTAVIMSVALFLSLSRSGVIVFFLTLVFMAALLHASGKAKAGRHLGIFFWTFVIVSLFLFFKDVEPIVARFKALFLTLHPRGWGHGYLWKDILRICRDFFLFGSGLGTFGSISAAYKTVMLQYNYTYAHSDFFQLLAETGISGFMCMAAFFLMFFVIVARNWLRRHDSFVVFLVLGGLTSIFGMLCYSLLDFNLQITANALLGCMITAITFKLAFTHFRSEHV